MVVFKFKSSSFNLFWFILYSVIVVSVQCYIFYRNILEYQDFFWNQWNWEILFEVGFKFGLIIVFFIVFLFFLLFFIFRIGNYGNDGYKLGWDYVICLIFGGILDYIGLEFGCCLWCYVFFFVFFFYVLLVFCFLFLDVLILVKEIQF